MRELMMVPCTWPCDHYSCPMGFFVYHDNLYLRVNIYKDLNEEGKQVEFQGPELVHPCKPVWIEIED